LKELANSVGTSVTAVHRYESGWDRFEIRTLRRLAAALHARLEIRLEPIDHDRASSVSPFDLVRRIRPLFWDVDLTTTHLVENPQWVVRRVLQYGGWDEVSLVRRHFGDDAIRLAVQHRSVDARTRRLWSLVLEPEQTS
jgi:AcrR family transcriptional regulator